MATWMRLVEGDASIRVNVAMTEFGFSWTYSIDGALCKNELPYQQILPARVLSHMEGFSLIVQYVKVAGVGDGRIQARLTKLVFLGSSDDCKSVQSKIDAAIKIHEPQRPKRLLIFINPTSGFGRAVRDYYEVVAPIMASCRLEVNHLVTKSETHAAEVLADYDLSSIDAVLSMGGDGSLAQVTNALIRRTMKDLGKDIDDPTIEPVSPSIPVASIPGGSGCAVAYYTSGAVNDVETAILSVILGKTTPYDVLGIRQGRKCLGFSNIVAGCGSFSNVFMTLERLKRWMGKYRYMLVLPLTWWKFFSFDLEVDYLPVPDEQRNFSLNPGCDAPLHRDMHISEGPRPGWKTLRCRSSEVGITLCGTTDFMLAVNHGKYEPPKTALGTALIAILRGGGYWDGVWGFRQVGQKGRAGVERRYLEQIEVSEFRVRSSGGWRDGNLGLVLHIDGDPVDLKNRAEFEVRIHPRLLSFFCLEPNLAAAALAEH